MITTLLFDPNSKNDIGKLTLCNGIMTSTKDANEQQTLKTVHPPENKPAHTQTCQEFHENGAVKFSGDFYNGVRNGPGNEYYDTGICSTEGSWKNNKLDGIAATYWQTGNPRFNGHFCQGKKQGPGTSYFKDNGRKHFDGVWKDDGPSFGKMYQKGGALKKEGSWSGRGKYFEGVGYFRNGNKDFEGLLENDLMSEFGKSYYENGNLKYVGNFENGRLDGAGTAHHWNGVIQYEGNFEAGLLEGVAEKYDFCGRFIMQGRWKKGVMVKYLLTEEQKMHGYEILPHGQTEVGGRQTQVYIGQTEVGGQHTEVYIGQTLNGVKSGFGMEFDADSEMKLSEGQWENNKKSGTVKLFSRRSVDHLIAGDQGELRGRCVEWGLPGLSSKWEAEFQGKSQEFLVPLE